MRPGPAHGQRPGDATELGRVDGIEPDGQAGGEGADEGVAGAGGVDDASAAGALTCDVCEPRLTIAPPAPRVTTSP